MGFCAGKMFPGKYQGGFFSPPHGAWNRTTPVGAQVLFTSLKADGTADKTEVFAERWLNNSLCCDRPLDVAVTKDGSLLNSDDFAGAIYHVFDTAQPRGSACDLHCSAAPGLSQRCLQKRSDGRDGQAADR